MTRTAATLALTFALAGCSLGDGTSGNAGAGAGSAPESRSLVTGPAGCASPSAVQKISFSGTKYPNIRAHYRRAVRHGEPRVLVLTRAGADVRRDRLLRSTPTKPGFDRDEYPPAVGRTGWKASVHYVPSGENRSHGATMGIKLRRFCDKTRFRYVFY